MRILLETAFWLSVAMLAYTFAGYPVVLGWVARLRSKLPQKAPMQPSLSVLIAVYNGEAWVERKLNNLFGVPWPKDKIEVIIISDGSTDRTEEIVSEYAKRDPRVKLLRVRQGGKSAALSAGVTLATGEVLVLTDVRQLLEPEALSNMMSNYADPTVGGVSGMLLIGSLDKGRQLSGESLKWGIENTIREREGAIASVVGALGAFYSIRRELFTPIPPGLLLDDMWVPLHVVKQGKRIVFEKGARAWDDVEPTKEQEYRRKVRTLTGNYQLIKAAPWLLHSNPIIWQYAGHKLCRLAAPFALAVMFVSSLLLLPSPLYLLAVIGQVCFYALAFIGVLPMPIAIVRKLAGIAHTFVMLNAAAFMGLVNFLRGREDVWVRR